MITEGKAVALDAAIDVLLAMYDISPITQVKPIRWLRGNIKKIQSQCSESTAVYSLKFWIFRDPKRERLVLVELHKEPIGSWQPTQVGVAEMTNFLSKNLIWEFRPGEPKPVLVR